MRIVTLAVLGMLLGWGALAEAQLVAEQVTVGNAGTHLFGGSDADGGVGDWYLSNGVIEAVVDDVAPQADLPPGVPAVPQQSEAAFTGGSVIDLALVGADNDQLNILFTVGGLSTSNFIAYDTIAASTDASSARITVTGTVLGFEPLGPDDLKLTTEYIVAGSDSFLTIRSTIRNDGPTGAFLLGAFLDVFPWTTRAIVPFSPGPGLGFRHAALDVNNLTASLELVPYAAGPGNVSPADGVVDTATGAPCGEVSYGLIGIQTEVDPAGPTPPTIAPVNLLFGASGVQATAMGNQLAVPNLQPGMVFTYERRVYVGAKNDVASVTNQMLPVLAPRLGFTTGTISGDVDAEETASVAANVIATRTAGSPITNLPLNSPVTQFRTDADGGFAGVVLPAGTYTLEVRAVNRDPVVIPGVVVGTGADTPVAVPALTRLVALDLTVVHRMPGPDPLLPAKVTIRGLDGTPDPEFAKDFEAIQFKAGEPDVDLGPESFGGALAQGRWVYLPDGTATVHLRPGRYELFASRGLEYTAQRRRIRLGERPRRRRLRLRQVVATPDAISADFHIHSARSLDTSATPVGRVAAFVGEGVEVMVSSDHDFVLDYAPVISSLGLDARITSIVGTEVTTTAPNPPAFPEAVGHLNAWPLTVDPTARRDGSVEDEYVAPNFLFSRLRTAGAAVIQYNHPRAGTRGLGSIGFFNTIGCNRCENDIDQTCTVNADCPVSPAPRLCQCVGYRPELPITAVPNDTLLDDDVTGISGVANPDGLRNIDFDVIEVGNGLNNVGLLQVREDWFSLLNQVNTVTPSGTVPFLPGTGVSDSHRNTLESAGFLRTYVLGVGDDPAALDIAAFNAGIKAGRMMATSGPFIEFSIRDAASASAGLGETLVPVTGTVTLSIRVQATNWIEVEEVRVVANGQVVPGLVFDQTTTPNVRPGPLRPWSPQARPLRFEHELELTLTEDTWLLVEAGTPIDPLSEPDEFADTLVPDLVPYGFTNPIFVDLGGDGFDPPGVVAGAAPGVTGLAARAVATSPTAARHAEHERQHHVPLDRITFPPEIVPGATGAAP
jgi:hypothetical protein